MTPRQGLDSLFASWLGGDPLRAAAHFTPDATYREARRGALVGRDALVAHFTRFFRDGPRWRFEVDDVVVEGDRAAVRFRFALKGGESGWRERAGCAFVTFVGGAIAEWREYEG